MKKLFKQAHKMTKEIAAKYEVNYQAQFTLCLNYLLENKEEAIDKEVKEELIALGVENEQIEKVNETLSRFTAFTNEIATDMYNDRTIRATMNAKGLWDYRSYAGVKLEFKDRYTGKGKVKITRQKVWNNYGKIRVYFDVTIDDVITLELRTTIK